MKTWELTIAIGIALILTIINCIVSYHTSKRMHDKHEAEAKFNAAHQLELKAQAQYDYVQKQYNDLMENGQKELDKFFDSQRQTRQSELDTEFSNLRTTYEEKAAAEEKRINEELQVKINEMNNKYAEFAQQVEKNKEAIVSDIENQEKKYESLLEPIRKYELEQQEKLYYTIQIPPEYQSDLQFLLEEVAPKMRHPDAVSKLVYSECVKPFLDEALKRLDIRKEPGIYKITNINTQKAYVGQSTDVRSRLTNHVKAACGINTIAHQAVHEAMAKEGIWNWSIEVIEYVPKEQLNEREKFYIQFFDTQKFGYNKTGGGS